MSIDKINAVWSEWNTVEQLGAGSFGKVYKVVREQHGITSFAAVKVISIPQSDAELASVRAEGLDEAGTRSYFKDVVTDFVNEINLMQSMKGTSNIVSIEDYQVVEKTDRIGWDIFIRMELLTPLTDYTAGKKLSEAEVIKLGQDVCSALELCARRNIIHRDIKPENIFISPFGDFKIGDFGIARKLEKTDVSLSRKGSPNYMAPEVNTSKEYDATVDIYSLGMVLYRLLNNNHLPFLDPNAQLIQYQERKTAIDRRLRGEALPAPINASPEMTSIILTACAFKPSERFKSPTAMKNALGAVTGAKQPPALITPSAKSSQPIRKSMKTAIIAASVFITIAALCLAAWFIFRDDEPEPANVLDILEGDDETPLAQEYPGSQESLLLAPESDDDTNIVDDVIAIETTTPEATEIDLSQAALLAYRDYISTEQSFDTWWGTINWNKHDIRYARFVDFDNDGILELILVVEGEEFPIQAPEDHREHFDQSMHLLVIGYYGEVQLHYNNTLFSGLGSIDYYELALSINGQSYLISHGLDHGDTFITIHTLVDNEFVSEIKVDYYTSGDVYIDGVLHYEFPDFDFDELPDFDFDEFMNDVFSRLNLTVRYTFPTASQIREFDEHTKNSIVPSLLAEIEQRLAQ